MDIKRKLLIAYTITQNYDYVNNEDAEALDEYVNEINFNFASDFTEEEVSQTLETYNGYSASDIEDMIVREYFKQN